MLDYTQGIRGKDIMDKASRFCYTFFFLIRNLFIRKLGWRIGKNKKKTKKFSSLTQKNLKK